MTTRSRAILKKVLTGNNGIQTRYLALDLLEEAFEINPDALHARFSKHAPELATRAAENALQDSGTPPEEIDALIISTCTGYLCPGLTSYVAERLGLRAEVATFDLVGQGCGAALPNFRTGEALVSGGRAKKVLSVCVEVCSAAFYLDDDPGVLISACLFGDGAAAAVLSKDPNLSSRRVRWLTSDSLLIPEKRDLLRFEQRNGMLRNILSPQVPEIAAGAAQEVLQKVLSSQGIPRSDIRSWIFHAGGRDVLSALQQTLALQPDDLCWSARILQEYGNLSSPFVYFVLDAALKGNAPNGLWWMSSFGAGFSCHGALVEVA